MKSIHTLLYAIALILLVQTTEMIPHLSIAGDFTMACAIILLIYSVFEAKKEGN